MTNTLLALLLVATPPDTGRVVFPTGWLADAAYAREWLDRSDFTRERNSLRIGRRAGRGAIYVEGLLLREEEYQTGGAGVELYTPLGARMDLGIRGATAPEAYGWADWSAGGESNVYLPHGWSIGAGGEFRRYDRTDISRASLLLGNAGAHWSIGLRGDVVFANDEALASGNLRLRRTLGRFGFIEASGGAGREVVDFSPHGSLGVEPWVSASWIAAMHAEIPFVSGAGLLVGGEYVETRDYGSRIRVQSGIRVRW